MASLPSLRRSCAQLLQAALWTVLLVGVPLALAYQVLGLWDWNLTIPLVYGHGDQIWQLVLTKMLVDTGWILNDPYLGAPGIAHWYNNAAAETSALHSVLMLGLSLIVHNPVRLQQIYYLLNFPLICVTSFLACRLLGIARLPAFATGLLYAFTTYRLYCIIYAFLANYFMVPLALVSIIWVLGGRFVALFDEVEESAGPWARLARILRSRDFLLGLVFVILMAVSDGYYTFFTLLLLGFAAGCRALIGDWRRPLTLVPVGVYIAALLGAALALQWPLHQFKETHRNEFYPGGVEDPALVKHAFEAEVYSTSLKMLMAPIPGSRIAMVGNFGNKVAQTNDAARKFKEGPAFVPLGTLGSVLFGIALTLIAVPAARREAVRRASVANFRPDLARPPDTLLDTLLSLTLFIFLCSIFGGLGTLIALVFPTIRAYNRFPLFLIFVLYLMGAWFTTRRLGGPRRVAWTVFLLLVTVAALFDQIPKGVDKGSAAVKARFLADGHFVHEVESALPPGAMVYQFPYSQYLRNSKYYGWGSFAGLRLYLHSHDLHWSNGGAKNSPADNWDYFVSKLPPKDIITEVEAAGFRGLVVDRTVVNAEEYHRFYVAFVARGDNILDDARSKLVFVKLRDPGYRLVYGHNYREVESIIITDPTRMLTQTEFSRFVNGSALKRFIASHGLRSGMVITRAKHPAFFVDEPALLGGLGQTAIKPITSLLGHMVCKMGASHQATNAPDTVLLTLDNQSLFDWRLGSGRFPIGIGVHILRPNGKLLSWDTGFRVHADTYIRRGTSYTFRVRLNTAPFGAYVRDHDPVVAKFGLVQDGNAWFGRVTCTVLLQ